MDAYVKEKESPVSQSRGKIQNTIAYFFAFIGLGLAAAALGPTLPGLAENTRTGLSQISVLFTTRSFGYLAGSFIAGRLYDRFSGHAILVGVIFSMAATMALTPLIPQLWLLALVMLILGFSENAVDVGANTLLMWTHGRKVGPYMNALHFFFGLGAFLSPVIVAQVIQRSGGIYWAYWVMALLMAPAAIWVLRLPSPARRDGTEDGGQPVRLPLLAFLIAFFLFLYVSAEVSFGGWIFTYTSRLALLDETGAAYITSAFWGALTLGRLASIPLAARFRPSRLLLGDLLGCLLSMVIILQAGGSSIAIWVGSLGLGFSMASIFPTMLSWAERRMTITGQVTGWFFAGAGAGGMFLPWLIGQLFESVGPQVAMQSILIDLVLALFVFGGLMLYSSRLQTEAV